MNIKETFLELTSHTFPHGKESELFKFLPTNLETDEFGNKFILIGETKTMFACHLDTATQAYTNVTHVFDGDIIKTDGTSILGADDKAGVTIILNMIENNVPGLYYFFLGEEVGCVGSKKLAEKVKNSLKIDQTSIFSKINKVISFDRRGTTSVITHQCSSRCCSDNFANELSKQLNDSGKEILSINKKFEYKPDNTGLYTDSAQFIRIYPECTNISVGYKSEHTTSENQDITFLEKLCRVTLKIDWENLPVERDHTKYEYKTNSYGYNEWADDDYYYRGYNRNSYVPPRTVTPESKEDVSYFLDSKYRYVCSVKFNRLTKKLVEIDFAEEKIDEETDSISEFLKKIGVSYHKIEWDGLDLKLSFEDAVTRSITYTSTCKREELSEFIPELDFWKKEIEEDNLVS